MGEKVELNCYESTTDDISVRVLPIFLEEQSYPHIQDDHFTWGYHVTLHNQSDQTVQLLSRYWRITDANGLTQEVRGPGVIGQQPTLSPGEQFEYSSGTHLPTASGLMAGIYEMQDMDGNFFNIEIPAFSLDSPEQIARPN